jgi:hypothetical protein
VRADGIGDAQAGPEIVRILDAVEDQQQGRLFERIEHVVERDVTLCWIDGGDHSLVPGAGRHRRQAPGLHRQHAHLGELRLRQQVAQPRVVATGIDVDLVHRAGVVAQFGECGMEAENQARRSGHGTDRSVGGAGDSTSLWRPQPGQAGGE